MSAETEDKMEVEAGKVGEAQKTLCPTHVPETLSRTPPKKKKERKKTLSALQAERNAAQRQSRVIK